MIVSRNKSFFSHSLPWVETWLQALETKSLGRGFEVGTMTKLESLLISHERTTSSNLQPFSTDH